MSHQHVTFCDTIVRFDWCRTNRIDSVCGVTWISLCAKDGFVITWGRGGETSSRRVVSIQCAVGLSSMMPKHTANPQMLDRCCMLQQHATRHFKVSHLRALVKGWYCNNDWLYQEKLPRLWLKNGYLIRNSFPYTIPICKILYELKLYYSQLMESCNMNTFLVGIFLY